MASDDTALIDEFIKARTEPRPHTPPSEQGRRSTWPRPIVCKISCARRSWPAASGWPGGRRRSPRRAAQAANQLAEPGCAFLLASGVLASGAEIPFARFSGLAVEAEVAFVMRHDLAGPGVTAARAATAVEGALPALELVDFRYSGKPVGTDVVAEGVYAVRHRAGRRADADHRARPRAGGAGLRAQRHASRRPPPRPR